MALVTPGDDTFDETYIRSRYGIHFPAPSDTLYTVWVGDRAMQTNGPGYENYKRSGMSASTRPYPAPGHPGPTIRDLDGLWRTDSRGERHGGLGRYGSDDAPAMRQTPTTKDSGKRESYDNGMVRDTQIGKARFDLLVPEYVPYADQLLTRFAELMARGADKYGNRNWEKARGHEAYQRARASAFRHLMQWFCGEDDEDHAVAVLFNIMMAESIKSADHSDD